MMFERLFDAMPGRMCLYVMTMIKRLSHEFSPAVLLIKVKEAEWAALLATYFACSLISMLQTLYRHLVYLGFLVSYNIALSPALKNIRISV